MHHPLFQTYFKRQRWSDDPFSVFETFKKSLDKSKYINDLQWAAVVPVFNVSPQELEAVYRYGWDRCPRLRQQFLDIVGNSDVFTKPLEEYL